MKNNLKILLSILAGMAIYAEAAFAGNFSTALANTNSGAIDAAIPGFVGAAGDGVTATATNGNYVNPIFQGWATHVVDYSPAPGVHSDWKSTGNVLGEVTANNFNIVSLGDLYHPSNAPAKGTVLEYCDNTTPYSGDVADLTDPFGFIGYDAPGSLTLGFDKAITNGAGADFAAFENGFGSNTMIFAELGYVEVSTDGLHFARFPSVSETASKVSSYGQLDPTGVYNLVGKHTNGYGDSWGTPFDLDDLRDNSLVTGGLVDLAEINYVRIVDIPGSGDYLDSRGKPIYDAWLTKGSGGVDFEALGVIHQVPEPSGLFLAVVGTIGLAVYVLRKRMAKRG